jgi:hypothetical protein
LTCGETFFALAPNPSSLIEFLPQGIRPRDYHDYEIKVNCQSRQRLRVRGKKTGSYLQISLKFIKISGEMRGAEGQSGCFGSG